MIDKSTGAIRFTEWPCPVTPDTTRTAFLTSPLAVGAEPEVQNGPWFSWRLAPPECVEGGWFTSLHFHNDTLWQVSMAIGGAEYGSSWSDWSEEKENKRRLRHDAALTQWLGPEPYQFPWGKIWSGYDGKGGFSSITVTYIPFEDFQNK